MTHKKRLTEQLKSIAPNITETDRKEFMEMHEASAVKLSRYLNGNVGDNDEAIKMLLFFRKKISNREKLINQNF